MSITVEDLRIPTHNEAVMQQWDAWRTYIKNGGGGSWPRDAFEAMLDELDNERSLAADEIDALRHVIHAQDDARKQVNARNTELVEVLDALSALAEKNVYPQPDKPFSDWAVVVRARDAVNRARGLSI